MLGHELGLKGHGISGPSKVTALILHPHHRMPEPRCGAAALQSSEALPRGGEPRLGFPGL